MIKYKAEQVPPEEQDSHLFYITRSGEFRYEEDFFRNISIVPRRGYYDYLTDDVQSVYSVLDSGDLAYCMEENDCMSFEQDIRQYLPARKPDGADYTPDDLNRVKSLVLRDYEHSGIDLDILCSILSIVTGKEYASTTIHGCCQNDWRYIVYPSGDYSPDDIQTFETMFFNTGSEWIITELDNPDFDDCGMPAYCTGYSDDKILEELCSYAECMPDEIEVYKFSGYTRIPNYEKI